MVVLRLKSNVCKYLPLALLCLNLVPSWARTDGDSRSGHSKSNGCREGISYGNRDDVRSWITHSSSVVSPTRRGDDTQTQKPPAAMMLSTPKPASVQKS